jgi:predicted phosphodiesterase
MKITVFSDTHGEWHNKYKRAAEMGSDLILHCGDIETLTSKYDLPYYTLHLRFTKQSI